MNTVRGSSLKRSGLDRQLGFVMREANVAIWNDLKRTLEPVGLKPVSYATLLVVDTSPGCKQQDIADALGIQRPNLVALIDSLVGQKIIARHVNPGDRRSYALRLTDTGRALLERARTAHRAHEDRLAAALGDIDQADLIEAAWRLARLDAHAKGDAVQMSGK